MSRPCTSCPNIIPSWDPHPLCIGHRGCSRGDPCASFCIGLSKEHFDVLERSYFKSLRPTKGVSTRSSRSSRQDSGKMTSGSVPAGSFLPVSGSTSMAGPSPTGEGIVGGEHGKAGFDLAKYGHPSGKRRADGVALSCARQPRTDQTDSSGVTLTPLSEKYTTEVGESGAAPPYSDVGSLVVDKLSDTPGVVGRDGTVVQSIGNLVTVTEPNVVMTMAGAAPAVVYQTTHGSMSTPCASRSDQVIDQSTSQSIGQYPIGAHNQKESIVQSPQVVVHRDSQSIGLASLTSSDKQSRPSLLIGSGAHDNREALDTHLNEQSINNMSGINNRSANQIHLLDQLSRGGRAPLTTDNGILRSSQSLNSANEVLPSVASLPGQIGRSGVHGVVPPPTFQQPNMAFWQQGR